MPRTKYRISAGDAHSASVWIERKFGKWPRIWPHENWDKNVEAEEEFRGFLGSRLDRDAWAKFLNDWCERHLDSRQWNQLKNAVRAARKREAERRSLDGRRRVDLRDHAHSMLRTIARRHQMTLSDVIERFLREEYERCL